MNTTNTQNINKVIAVTGGSRGIGAAIVKRLAEDGWTVGCLTRKGQGVEDGSLPANLQSQVIALACDVNSDVSLKEAFNNLVDQTGRLDGLVNNAGIHKEDKSHQMSNQLWDDVMSTNAKAVFMSCREAYPHLSSQKSSVIVNIGSFFDKMGVKGNLAYCASKAAVGAITRCLAVEWASKGIRVMDVAPGYIATELNADAMNGPLGEFLAKRIPRRTPGTPAEVATVVASIARDEMSFLTGETIYVDGAHAIAH